MEVHDAFGDIAALVDRRAPGVARFLAALRWGGLRTITPDRRTWGVEVALGLGLGLGVREGMRSATAGRVRIPAVPAAATGWFAVHAALWRWDTVRWRRHRVALVVDLPLDDVVAIVDRLADQGLPVERWERGVRGGDRVHGIWCRAGDVRSVNRAIDEAALEGGGASPRAAVSR
ncbi:hypothetical protein [Dermatobacter hominis]|uniref:hypothetical protein n=1 Tax=Dermatobacter hominis TaxID=2884263 RepID=UPI001D11AB58|nr:hypothetical protein [Dermatobacter hominis]UDY35404.1 hypothetical protein LH044_18995 [Dermatobacter hominis]